MTERRSYQVNHSQRSLTEIMVSLGMRAAFEESAGDYQKALYLRFLQATLMNGVLQDEPEPTT